MIQLKLQLTFIVRMGNSNQTQESELTFVQLLEDRHFGEVEIYRSSSGLFIMKLCRTAISGDKRHLEQLSIIQAISSSKMGSIIPIVHIQRSQQKGLCIKYEKADIYTEYYNFTLRDLLATKKEPEQAELWFILASLLQLVATLRVQQITAHLELDKVFLTPAGIPCIYHYQLQSCKDSITYSQLTPGQSIAKIVMQLALSIRLEICSEEELLKEQALFTKLITKYKLLGNSLRNLVTQARTEQEILEDILELKEEELIHVASQVKLLKFKYYLPENPQFLNLPTLSKTPSSASGKTQNKQNKIINPLGKSIKNSNAGSSSHAISQDQPRKTLNTQGSHIKQRASQANSVATEPSNQKSNCFYKTKQQTTKMLSDLDKKKEEYRLQMEKFQLRKEELLKVAPAKESEHFAREMRRSEKRKQAQGNGRKLTQNSRVERYR